MKLQFAFISLMILGWYQSEAQITWDGGGGNSSWNTAANWNPDGVPDKDTTDPVTLDCNPCTITVTGDTEINSSLTIASGTILDLSTHKLEIGKSDVTAFLTNNGTIQNSAELKIKGTGTYGQGPTLTNNGTIQTITKLSAGNNNGGGIMINTSPNTISATEAHVDGQITNEGDISVSGEFLLHGGILAGSGTLDAGSIKLSDNPGDGAAGAGNGGQIQGGNLGATGGCNDGSGNTDLEYYVGNTGPLTFFELLDTYGASDADLFVIDEFDVSSCGDPAYYVTLPVDLTHFTCDWSESGAFLEWTTASELDNSHFFIERSLDGKMFNQIGRVEGHGTTSEVHQYSYLDQSQKENYYYRLKQMDYDGAFEYSSVVRARSQLSSGFDVLMYPNPTNDQMFIRIPGFTEKSVATAVMFNSAGKVVFEKTLFKYQSEVEMQTFQRGVYLLQINYLNQQYINRVVLN